MDVNQFLDENKSLLGSIMIHCQKYYGVNVTDADFQMIGDEIRAQQSEQGYYSLFIGEAIISKLQEAKKMKFDLERKKYKTLYHSEKCL